MAWIIFFFLHLALNVSKDNLNTNVIRLLENLIKRFDPLKIICLHEYTRMKYNINCDIVMFDLKILIKFYPRLMLMMRILRWILNLYIINLLCCNIIIVYCKLHWDGLKYFKISSYLYTYISNWKDLMQFRYEKKNKIKIECSVKEEE